MTLLPLALLLGILIHIRKDRKEIGRIDGLFVISVEFLFLGEIMVDRHSRLPTGTDQMLRLIVISCFLVLTIYYFMVFYAGRKLR